MLINRVYQSIAAYAPGVAPPSSSGWGDHGSFIDLSTTAVTDDTCTANANDSFTTVRGTQSYDSGKRYFEIKLLTAPGADAIFVGLVDGSTTPANTETLPRGIKTYCNDGTALVDGGGLGLAGNALGSALALSNGDVLGIAFDADNGFHYLAKNNTWQLSGDPTSGVSGTGNIGTYTGTALAEAFYPTVSIWGLVNCVVQLVTGAGALTYSPPSGYSAWG